MVKLGQCGVVFFHICIHVFEVKKKDVGIIFILLGFLIPELWLERMIERGKSDYKG